MKDNWVFVFVLLAILPVLLLRDFTPGNELRYLSIADEALRNGTFVTFSNHGMVYADKPPIYFWIIMMGRWLLGGHYMWFLSLFSVIPAFVIVRTMDRWVAGKVDGEYRLTGKLLMLSCGLFTGIMIVLRMDMLMCMFITLSLYTFYRMMIREGNRRDNAILFPVYVFLAVFTKGPVGILIPLAGTTAFLLLTGRIRSIGYYWGWRTWLVLLTCCSIWFMAVYMEGGWEYLHNLLFHQTMDRAVHSFHHEAPFYYYLISIWYSLLPWSLLLIGILAVAIYRRKVCTELQKFFLTIIGVSFLLLSLISSKIEVYMLPAFPFIVYLALTYFRYFKWNQWIAASVGIPSVIFCLSVPVLIGLAKQDDSCFWGQRPFYIAAGVLTITGFCSLYILYHRKEIGRAIRTIAYGLFCSVFISSWALSGINGELGYRELCDKAAEIAGDGNATGYYVWKLYRPENMDVYLHKEIQAISPEELAASGLHGVVFMLPASRLKELPPYFSGRRIYGVGHYAIIMIH